ncbi:class I SAM-dependent methyltransferase [uncultured Maricaulis sp.]|uniref:class I SAM-dependent methyltransferase n=1 Tax=uncultured Maricaulis sp. TaxID=174710 RepID=UPI0030D95DCE|tara:strand:+ start:38596 stop:39426 length:831 start_codon:yes stop_codon:yes gene_type:complete
MSAATLNDDDYIIGANQAEIERLGLQHAIWREAALQAWQSGGIRPGMTVMDVGAGPGYASFDLARMVGPSGRVIAVDQSALFLDALREGAAARRLGNIETVECDLADYDWPQASCDAIWSRWCLCFVPDPDAVLAGIDRALKPGGRYITQEYGDYRSFRLEPRAPVFDRFLAAVEASWRHFGGDPNVAQRFPKAFAALGWQTLSLKPIVHAGNPGDWIWQWPLTWLEQAPARLVDLGFLGAEDAVSFAAFVAERQADPASLMITPMVLETIARKAD